MATSTLEVGDLFSVLRARAWDRKQVERAAGFGVYRKRSPI